MWKQNKAPSNRALLYNLNVPQPVFSRVLTTRPCLPSGLLGLYGPPPLLVSASDLACLLLCCCCGVVLLLFKTHLHLTPFPTHPRTHTHGLCVSVYRPDKHRCILLSNHRSNPNPRQAPSPFDWSFRSHPFYSFLFPSLCLALARAFATHSPTTTGAAASLAGDTAPHLCCFGCVLRTTLLLNAAAHVVPMEHLNLVLHTHRRPPYTHTLPPPPHPTTASK